MEILLADWPEDSSPSFEPTWQSGAKGLAVLLGLETQLRKSVLSLPQSGWGARLYLSS